jgi:hypothetical protein
METTQDNLSGIFPGTVMVTIFRYRSRKLERDGHVRRAKARWIERDGHVRQEKARWPNVTHHVRGNESLSVTKSYPSRFHFEGVNVP